jgi:serine/threonine protein kinase/formylglycine-generating enzyme required for sulfatase activity
MATTIEFLKRTLLDRGQLSPEKISEFIEQASKSEMSFPELLVDKAVLRDDELGDLLATYVETSREEDPDAYENALFGQHVVEKGLAWCADVWKALAEMEAARNQGKFKSLEWYLVKEGRITGEKILEILDQIRRKVVVCNDCGRRQIIREDTAPENLECRDCRGVMDAATDPSDFKTEDAKEYDPLIGKEIGGCRIESSIGKGGMGTVYKARQLALNKTVAVKILTSGEMTDAARKRFLREARTAARLEHWNIVQVYNTGQEGDHHYIVMQYVDGPTVSQIIKGDGPIPVDETLRISLEAARGIQAAHNLGMIHRDIKPDNLMIDKTQVVKVTDFGLAKDLTMESNLTIPQQAMGTPSYMSPEQAEDAATVDKRSDIYSFGATIYAMLAGKPPFVGSSAWAVVSQHMNEPVPDIQETSPEAPSALQHLIEKMMAKKVDDRVQDMAGVIEGLLNVQDILKKGGSPPPATPAEPEVTVDVPGDVLLRSTEDTAETITGMEERAPAAPPPKKPPEKPPSKPAEKPAETPSSKTPVPDTRVVTKRPGVSPVMIGGIAGAVLVAAVVVVLVIVFAGKGPGPGNGGGGGTGSGDNGGSGDTSGGGGATTKGTKGAATTPIKIVDLLPKENSFHNSSEVRVEGRVEGGRDVKVLVYSDPVVVSDGRFQKIVKLGDGPGTIFVSAWSGEDKANKIDERINVIVDTQKPKLSLHEPKKSHGVIYCKGTSLQISVAMDETYPEKVDIEGIEAKQADKLYIAEIPIPKEGTQLITVRGFDKAQNVAEMLLEVIRDTQPPTITLVDHKGRVKGGDPKLYLRFTVNEVLLTARVNGKTVAINKEGKYSVPVPLKEGRNPLVIEVSDRVGNPARKEVVVEYFSDRMLARLEQEENWKTVLAKIEGIEDIFGKMALVRAYVEKYPNGILVLDARKLISQLKKEGLPAGVVRTEKKGVYLYEKVGVEMVRMSGGSYPMGRDGGKAAEGPAHSVSLSPYFIYRTEVTNAMFAKYLNESGKTTAAPGLTREGNAWVPAAGRENEPVTNITWDEAAAYAKWSGGSLPTEAQWEAAARGTGSGPYPWGEAEPDKERCNCRGAGPGALMAATSLPPGASPAGALHMAGNVAEWCSDTFHEDAYKNRKSGDRDPLEARESFSRVLRGGGFQSPPAMCAVYVRIGLAPNTKMPWIGFRVVMPEK